MAHYADDHERVPDRVMYASESFQVNAMANWEAVREHSFVIGEFVWSGMDYLGEAGIGRVFEAGEVVLPHWKGNHFPWHGAACGDIDIIGQRKPLSYYRETLWNEEPGLYMAVEAPGPDGQPWQLSKWAPRPLLESWTWPGHEGEELNIEVFSRYELVRIFSGRNLVGEAAPSPDKGYLLKFSVPYEPGSLTAKGLIGEAVVETVRLETADKPASIHLVPDRIHAVADTDHLIFVEVEIRDNAGRLNPVGTVPVEYEVEGPASIQAIGNGNLASTESYLQNPRHTFEGRTLVVIRSTGDPGIVHLTAKAKGLRPSSLDLEFTRYPVAP
jgi:beta-galactosidase